MCLPFLYFFAQPIVNTRGIVIANILRRTYGTFTCLVVRNKNYLLLPHFSLFPKGAKTPSLPTFRCHRLPSHTWNNWLHNNILNKIKTLPVVWLLFFCGWLATPHETLNISPAKHNTNVSKWTYVRAVPTYRTSKNSNCASTASTETQPSHKTINWWLDSEFPTSSSVDVSFKYTQVISVSPIPKDTGVMY